MEWIRSIRKTVVAVFIFLLVFVAVRWAYDQKPPDKNGTISWKPSSPETKSVLIFQAKWGEGEEFAVGFHKASKEEGAISDKYFDRFFVEGSRVFILDPVKEQISVFEKNILIRSYPRPSADSDQDIVVNRDSIYVLNLGGSLSRIDVQSGEYKVVRVVISQSDPEFMTYNSHQMYLVRDTLLITSGGYSLNKCYSADDLAEVSCPFLKTDRRKGKLLLESGFYAAITPTGSWLYDPYGKIVGVIDGINSYRVNLDGAYYREQTDADVKLFFKKWQK